MDATKAEPRSRRAILAAAAGAAGAAAAASLFRAEPVRAGIDGDLVLNTDNTGTAPTGLDGNLPESLVFRVSNTGPGPGSLAIAAEDDEGTAIAGYTISGNGLSGDALAEGTAVLASSGSGLGVDAAGFIGVYGFGDISVVGDTTSAGTGVYGFAGDVQAPVPPVNVGVYARSQTGTALQVQGKAKFSRSGKFSVLAGRTYATKSVAGVTTGSLVMAVLQSNESGRWIRAAVAGSGKITVYFNTALSTGATVGFIVFN